MQHASEETRGSDRTSELARVITVDVSGVISGGSIEHVHRFKYGELTHMRGWQEEREAGGFTEDREQYIAVIWRQRENMMGAYFREGEEESRRG